jgi:exonuclease SbcD
MGDEIMKIVHIADLHLGKMLHQYNLIDIQRELLENIIDYVSHHEIDAVIIAGDVYDRSVPSQEAVNLLNHFLSELITRLHKKVFMISGNHDSADRLNFASAILEEQGLFIETYLKEKIAFHQEGNIRFYMLPFVKPVHIKQVFEDAPTDNYHNALAYYLSKQEIDPSYKNILITHQFVGHKSQTSESELTLSIGGTEIIDPDIFDAFDYVALGHLHAPQYVKRETVRYSGSLGTYSFDEAKGKKSFVVVDIDDMHIEEVELQSRQKVRIIRGMFDELRSHTSNKDDLLSIELEDDHMIPHAMDLLREVYPHVLKLSYVKLIGDASTSMGKVHAIEKMNMMDLYKTFYQAMCNQQLDEKDQKIIETIWEEGTK